MLNELELQREILRLKRQIVTYENEIQENKRSMSDLEHTVTRGNEFGRRVEEIFSNYITRTRQRAANLSSGNRFAERYQNEVRQLLNSPKNRGAINKSYDLANKARGVIRSLEEKNYSLQRNLSHVEQELWQRKNELSSLKMTGK